MSDHKKKKEEDVKLENMEELLSYFESDTKIKKNNEKRPDLDSFSLITFLENDGKRLDRLTQLFGDKLSNHKTFNQTKNLVNSQEKHNNQLEAELIQTLIENDSALNKELANLWNQMQRKIN